jgi:hypothetical protein
MLRGKTLYKGPKIAGSEDGRRMHSIHNQPNVLCIPDALLVPCMTRAMDIGHNAHARATELAPNMMPHQCLFPERFDEHVPAGQVTPAARNSLWYQTQCRHNTS